MKTLVYTILMVSMTVYELFYGLTNDNSTELFID